MPSKRTPPIFMPGTPSNHPWITPPLRSAGNVSPREYDESKISPVEHATPMYFISTLLFGFTTGPVPTLRSLMTSAFGGGPTCTGTAGAPLGSVPFIFTHGLPAADVSVAVVVGTTVSLAFVVGGA